MPDPTDWALDLANRLGEEVWSPRMADFVTRAVTHCQRELCPLTRDQAEQVYRAAFEAGDGVRLDTAQVIDIVVSNVARRLVDALEGGDES